MLDFRSLKPIQCLAASVLMRERRLMLILPRQEGKTELGVRAIRSVLEPHVHRSALFLAKSKTAGQKATREKFARIFDDQTYQVNTAVVYRKDTASSVCYMDSVDKDPDRIRGGTYHFIHWSEVAFSKLEHGVSCQQIFEKVIQPTLRTTKGYVLLESTTNGKNGWYDLFEAAESLGFKTLRLPLSRLVEMGLVSVKEFDYLKETTHPLVFEQEYECGWVTFEGLAYPEFTDDLIDKDMARPAAWQHVALAIDWGWKPSATSILWAYVVGGVVHIFDEHYKMEELPVHTAESIIAKHALYGIEKFAAVADHDPKSIKELNLRKIPCRNANKVDTKGNRLEVKELMWAKRLKVHPRCVNLIKELKSATWDTKKEGEIDYNGCTWGHYDGEASLRYLVRELSKFEAQEPTMNPHLDDEMSARAWELGQRRKSEWR